MTAQYIGWGVSLALGAALLTLAVLICVLPRFKAIKWARYCVLPLLLTGFAGILGATFFGFSIAGIFQSLMDGLNGLLAGKAPGVAYLLPIILGLVSLAVFLHDMWVGAVDRRGIAAAAGVPLSISFIPGFGATAAAILGFFPVGFVVWIGLHIFHGIQGAL